MFVIRQTVSIAGVFGNVDADGILCHLRCPMLVVQSLKAAAYPFRPTAKTAPDHTLARSEMTKPVTIPLPPVLAMWSGRHWLILNS